MATSGPEEEPGPEGLTDIDRRVRAALDSHGVEYTPVPCDPDLADTAAFCAAYGYDTGDSANTIIVQTRDKPPRHAACVLLATTRLDVNGTVRRRLGRKSSFADAETHRRAHRHGARRGHRRRAPPGPAAVDRLPGYGP